MEHGTQAIESLTNNVILFVGSIIIAYVLITLFVHKTKLFTSMNKMAKEFIHKLLIVFAFGGLGYYFSVLF
jgi:hypothetical protein